MKIKRKIIKKTGREKKELVSIKYCVQRDKKNDGVIDSSKVFLGADQASYKETTFSEGKLFYDVIFHENMRVGRSFWNFVRLVIVRSRYIKREAKQFFYYIQFRSNVIYGKSAAL